MLCAESKLPADQEPQNAMSRSVSSRRTSALACGRDLGRLRWWKFAVRHRDVPAAARNLTAESPAASVHADGVESAARTQRGAESATARNWCAADLRHTHLPHRI